jgi:hypothetical protein
MVRLAPRCFGTPHCRRARRELENFPSGEKEEMVELCVGFGVPEQDAVAALGILAQHKVFFVELMMAMELCLLKPSESPVIIGVSVCCSQTCVVPKCIPRALLHCLCGKSVCEKAWRSRNRAATASLRADTCKLAAALTLPA